MFTGIVTAIGTVRRARRTARGLALTIASPYRGLRIGESIAVDGACLTVVKTGKGTFTVEAVTMTRTRTTFADFAPGRPVNLERSLRASDRLGGHLVSGHVDGVGRLASRRAEGRSQRLRFAVPRSLSRYIARKGSICVDGVSLTVNEAGASGFGVNIVPHTLRQTTLGRLSPGDPVNLEVDLFARYLERLIKK